MGMIRERLWAHVGGIFLAWAALAGQASAAGDTVTFSDPAYVVDQSPGGKDGWRYYPASGPDNFRVRDRAGERYLECGTAAATAMERRFSPQDALLELRWRWRSPNDSSLVVLGPANDDSTKYNWTRFRIQAGLAIGGRFMVAGGDAPDNSKWPLRQANRWYYMRLRMDLANGRYSYYMDTLADRSTEVGLYLDGKFAPGPAQRLVIKTNGKGTTADVDDIAWVRILPNTWVGGGADGNWGTAANWSGGLAPGAADEVVFDASSAKPCVLDRDAAVKGITITSGYTGSLDLGASALTLTGNADLSGGTFAAKGGRLRFAGTGVQSLGVKAGVTGPPVELAGTGTLRLSGDAALQSLLVGAGAFDFNGGNLTVTGNLTVQAGGPATLANLGGRTLTVGGDASLSGQAGSFLGLNPSGGWTISAKGSLNAAFALLANSTAGGSPGQAKNCTDGGGNSNWTFTADGPPLITRQPSDQSVNKGQPASFQVAAVGSAPLAFQWKKNGTVITGATSATYAIASADLADNGALFTCAVTNGQGTATSQAAKLTVTELPLVTVQPQDRTVAAGYPVDFACDATSSTTPLAFQWYRNGTAIPGATGKDYGFRTAAADNGALFKCVATNPAGSVPSREAKLAVVACGQEFAASPDTAGPEGGTIKLWGFAQCAKRVAWSVLSGPAPAIADPEVETLSVQLPRVAGDTVLAYRFTAFYNGGEDVAVRDVKVTVRNAIPEPIFTLPDSLAWDAKDSLRLQPAIANLAAVQASAAPAIAYHWTLSGPAVDSASGPDYLRLRNPQTDGVLAVGLCLDNGGPAACRQCKVRISKPTALALAALAGPAVRWRDGALGWERSARVRAWDPAGRLALDWRGRPGDKRALPAGARPGLWRWRVEAR